MNDDIRHLVALQEIAFEIRELEQQRRDGPARLAALDEEFTARVEEIGGARLRHEALVAERQRLLQERDEITLRLEKGQQKLMQVNNQREYSAVLNEIDLLKTRLSELESGLGERSKEIGELAAPAAEADQRIAEEKKHLDELKGEVETDRSSVDDRLAVLRTKREEIRARVPVGHLQLFERIERARSGIAVAPIDNGACGACHVKLRPQVINLCRRRVDLVTCDSCRRILYIAEDDATEPSSDSPSKNAADGTENAAAAAGRVGADPKISGRPAAGA